MSNLFENVVFAPLTDGSLDVVYTFNSFEQYHEFAKLLGDQEGIIEEAEVSCPEEDRAKLVKLVSNMSDEVVSAMLGVNLEVLSDIEGEEEDCTCTLGMSDREALGIIDSGGDLIFDLETGKIVGVTEATAEDKATAVIDEIIDYINSLPKGTYCGV